VTMRYTFTFTFIMCTVTGTGGSEDRTIDGEEMPAWKLGPLGDPDLAEPEKSGGMLRTVDGWVSNGVTPAETVFNAPRRPAWGSAPDPEPDDEPFKHY